MKEEVRTGNLEREPRRDDKKRREISGAKERKTEGRVRTALEIGAQGK